MSDTVTIVGILGASGVVVALVTQLGRYLRETRSEGKAEAKEHAAHDAADAAIRLHVETELSKIRLAQAEARETAAKERADCDKRIGDLAHTVERFVDNSERRLDALDDRVQRIEDAPTAVVHALEKQSAVLNELARVLDSSRSGEMHAVKPTPAPSPGRYPTRPSGGGE